MSEDLGGNPGRDVTTNSIISAGARSVVNVVVRGEGVLAGAPLIPVVLAEAAKRFGQPMPAVDLRMADGSHVKPGDVVAVMSGSTRVLLISERSMLNLVCRASGVATATSAWSTALAGTSVKVLDTRKTTPGLRGLEKYAVRVGGGTNKRMGLYDVAMIKDNHKLAAGSVSAAYAKVRALFPNVPVQVEVVNAEEAIEAVRAGARYLMLDNMAIGDMKAAVQAARRATDEPLEIEATGGLTLARAREYAWTGVDYLSVGALTHSSPILDIAVDLVQ
jgi:nicotinate-nucleotide pyrophosphorylase (carboxylating)